MLGFFKKAKKRVCVIGLDGVPCALMRKFIAEGTMPSMADLAQQGALHQMQVTLPEISSVSWTSFMTGANPGAHGIFGFIDLKHDGSKDVRYPNFRDVKIPTLWDRLGQNGKRCVIINQPSTYPARPLPGQMVSGFVALDLRKACYPARLSVALKEANYELDIDTARARKDADYLMQALNSSLEGRRAALDLLWDEEDWDYFEIVITGTDRLQHYQWRAIEDESHPLHRQTRDYYRKVDSFIGEVVERFKKKAGKENGLDGLFLLSDHGFTGIKKEFYLNAWLEQEGYLVHSAAEQPTLANLSPETKAFAIDPGRIYINRKDRFSDGCVEAPDAMDLMDEISTKLLGVKCDGKDVVQQVNRGAEIYSGSEAANAADLVVLTHYGYDAKGALGRPEPLMDTDLQGMHTWDDAFLWASRRLGDKVEITGLARIIESYLKSAK